MTRKSLWLPAYTYRVTIDHAWVIWYRYEMARTITGDEIAEALLHYVSLDRGLTHDSHMNELTRVSRVAESLTLLHCLKALNWNLQHVAETLGLGSTGGVLRKIRTLGGPVQHAYIVAQMSGLVRPGARRPRVSIPLKPRKVAP